MCVFNDLLFIRLFHDVCESEAAQPRKRRAAANKWANNNNERQQPEKKN